MCLDLNKINELEKNLHFIKVNKIYNRRIYHTFKYQYQNRSQ